MKVRVKQEGPKVLIGVNGREFLDIGWKEAQEFAEAIKRVAARAEEYDKAEIITFDSALLMRAGAPFTMSNNPKILDQARVEAGHNRTLRRSALRGIKSTSVVGTPTLIKVVK